MAKKKILVNNGSSHRCLEFFHEQIEEFAPVTKFTSFFETANFLLTPYQVDNNSITTIIENDRGEEMHLAGMNCGYIGVGPRATQDAIVQLGVDSEEAEKWIQYTSLSIDFSGKKPFLNPQFYPFFEKRGWGNTNSMHTSCYLDEFTAANTYDRVIYMVTPTYQNLHSYFNCLDVMQPIRVIYSLGEEPLPVNIAVSIDDLKTVLLRSKPYSDGRVKLYPPGTLRPNLVIYGDRFNLICCANEDEIAPLVLTTHSYLLNKPISDKSVHNAFGSKVYKKESLVETISNIFFSPPPQTLIGSFDVPDEKTRKGRRGAPCQ